MVPSRIARELSRSSLGGLRWEPRGRNWTFSDGGLAQPDGGSGARGGAAGGTCQLDPHGGEEENDRGPRGGPPHRSTAGDSTREPQGRGMLMFISWCMWPWAEGSWPITTRT